MNLKAKVKHLPSSPGVYLMKDSLGSIIYIGKAKNLKRRVQSYFRKSKSTPAKTQKLVKSLSDLEYKLTDTEFEAFLLESKLIKEFKPLYNKKLKSPLAYPYLVISKDKEYPKINVTNSPVKNDSNLYFGPYTSKNTVERALQGIKEYYKIICHNPSIKSSACLNHSLGLCLGMCLGGSAAEQYNEIIHKVIALLNGADLSIVEELKQKMLDAANKFDFESAAKYRDYMEAINFLINKEKVIEFTAENNNIVIIEPLRDGIIKLFLIKGNKVLFSEKYLLEQSGIEQLDIVLKTNILTYFKTNTPNSLLEVNRDELDEAQIIFSYLKGRTCSYLIIPDHWLISKDNTNLDGAFNKLLYNLKTREAMP